MHDEPPRGWRSFPNHHHATGRLNASHRQQRGWSIQLAHIRQYALPGSTSVGAPFALFGSGDEVVGGEGEGDGLVVVFVGVVVHPVDAGAGFAEPYVGEFIKKSEVLGEGEAVFSEE